MVRTLEGFIERGEMWDAAAMKAAVGTLEAETSETGDPLPAMLAKVFTAVLMRMEMEPIPEKLSYDVEAHVYQRLYKVLEACYDDLPRAEIRTRIEVFQRRLSRMIVEENPRPVDTEAH